MVHTLENQFNLSGLCFYSLKNNLKLHLKSFVESLFSANRSPESRRIAMARELQLWCFIVKSKPKNWISIVGRFVKIRSGRSARMARSVDFIWNGVSISLGMDLLHANRSNKHSIKRMNVIGSNYYELNVGSSVCVCARVWCGAFMRLTMPSTLINKMCIYLIASYAIVVRVRARCAAPHSAARPFEALESNWLIRSIGTYNWYRSLWI